MTNTWGLISASVKNPSNNDLTDISVLYVVVILIKWVNS